MSIHKLSHFLAMEDFADAHEPLYDGTGEPPSIETQKQDQESVGTGETAPAPVEATPTAAETSPTESDEPAVADAEETPVPKGEELEHDKVEEVEEEEKPLEESTTALEQYMPKAAMSSIMGFSSAEKRVLGSHVKRIHRLAGCRKGRDVNVSLESLNEAVLIGKARLIDLRVQKAYHKTTVSVEAIAAVRALTTTKDLPKRPREGQVFNVNGADWVFVKGQWVTRQGIYGIEDIDPTYSVPKTEADTDNAPLAHDMIQNAVYDDPVAPVEVAPAVEAYGRLLAQYKPLGISERAAAIVCRGLERAAKLAGMKKGSVSVEAYR